MNEGKMNGSSDEGLQDKNVDMKDSQTVIIKDTVKIEIRNVPIALKDRYMNDARKYCKGNWTYALARMLDAAEITPQFNLLLEKVFAVDEKINKHLNENKEEQQKRMQRMIIRQQMFSWKRVVQETIKVYKRAIEDFEK